MVAEIELTDYWQEPLTVRGDNEYLRKFAAGRCDSWDWLRLPPISAGGLCPSPEERLNLAATIARLPLADAERLLATMQPGGSSDILADIAAAGGSVAYRAIGRQPLSSFELRDALVNRYAWAVPCDDALDAIAAEGPVVEIGAGTGYWAALLRERGVDTIAYDLAPPVPGLRENEWHRGAGCWTRVLVGDHQRVAFHGDRALMQCWPIMDDSAYACLKLYERAGGQTVIYIGESEGGCNATADYFQALDRDWSLERTVRLPTYTGIHDSLWIYHGGPGYGGGDQGGGGGDQGGGGGE